MFQIEEATISEINQALESGILTSEQLVQLYLDRIAAYDQQGPTLNSVITLNSNALERAIALACWPLPSITNTVSPSSPTSNALTGTSTGS